MTDRSQAGPNDVDDTPVEPEPLPNRLVQTRVSGELYARIESAAKTETISIAAYVRRMLNTYTPGG